MVAESLAAAQNQVHTSITGIKIAGPHQKTSLVPERRGIRDREINVGCAAR
jgi:hypothetical protein